MFRSILKFSFNNFQCLTVYASVFIYPFTLSLSVKTVLISIDGSVSQCKCTKTSCLGLSVVQHHGELHSKRLQGGPVESASSCKWRFETKNLCFIYFLLLFNYAASLKQIPKISFRSTHFGALQVLLCYLLTQKEYQLTRLPLENDKKS